MPNHVQRRSAVTRSGLRRAGILILVAIGATALTGCVDLSSNKSQLKIRAGKSKTVQITAEVTGKHGEGTVVGTWHNTKVCAKASKPKLIKIKPVCHTRAEVSTGDVIKGKFTIKATKKAAKKKTKTYTVTFTASASDQDESWKPATTRVKVKVPKKKKKRKR